MSHKNIRNNYYGITKQKGLTLIELLVASFLGVLLTGVVGAMYLTSVSGFRSSNEFSRVQENTRFALHFIQQSIRQAGFSTCGNETREFNFLSNPFNSSSGGGLIGYEFDGTAFGDTYDLNYVELDSANSTDAEVDAARNANAGAVGDWSTIAGAGIPSIDNVVNSFFPLNGSDIVAIAIEEPQPDIIVSGVNGALTRLNVSSGPTLPQGTIVKVGNCFERNIFAKGNNGINLNSVVNSAADNNIAPAARTSTGDAFTQLWPAGTFVYTDTTRIFYVGTGASGLPALFMYESICGFISAAEGCTENSVPVELVEGVENMQIMYGEDTDADGVPDQYQTANDVTDFSTVNAVRVSLLMRAINSSEAEETNQQFTLVDGVDVTPIDSGALRYVVNSTIRLRGRE